MATQCEPGSNGDSGGLGECGGGILPTTRTFLVAKKQSRLNFPRRKRVHWQDEHAWDRSGIQAKSGPASLSSPGFRLPDSAPLPVGLLFPATVQILVRNFSFLMVLEPTGLTVKQHP